MVSNVTEKFGDGHGGEPQKRTRKSCGATAQPQDDDGESRDECRRTTSRIVARTRGDGEARSPNNEPSDQRLVRMDDGGVASKRMTSNAMETQLLLGLETLQ
ncbi:hypothetical protein Syun_020566 [Stephania yunnanensis]|uniref:Uncharacterized protein n=1 Tax=Stephania yunnanensis TaxID=152371 RepID=A0AAP0NPT0_9MAGN